METTGDPGGEAVVGGAVVGGQVPVRRPGPVRWLWYAFGGRLPERYRTWVLHDLTCRTWALRHIARALIQVSPVAVALFLFIPGSPGIRIAGVIAGLLLGLLYSCAYMYEIAEHRVAQAGYRVGTAHAVREESHWEARQAQAERYAAQWRPSPATCECSD